MTDPAITVRSALKANWALAAPLDVYNKDTNTDGVRFTTGLIGPKEDQPLFHISVQEILANAVPHELGMGVIRVTSTLQIDHWVVVEEETAKGPGKSMDNLWELRKEVIRILKANKTGLTDIANLYPSPTNVGVPLPELDRETPLLRFSQDWTCVYYM